MRRHAQALGVAFAVRLLLVFLIHVQWGPCLQHGDSQTWVYGSLGLVLGRPVIYLKSLIWPPAFKLLAAAVFKTFGFSIPALKTVQVLLGLIGIALAYLLALRLFDPSAALLCGLLTALLPVATGLSLSGLAEPLYLVFIETFFLSYLAGRGRAPSRRLRALAIVALAAALVTRYEALGFYAAFAAMEAWRFSKERRLPGAAGRLVSAVAVPLIPFGLWVFFAHRNFSDYFFWIDVTREDNARGFLAGHGPKALLVYVAQRAQWSYFWFLACVPAAVAGLWTGGSPRESVRKLNGAALGNMAALAAAASLRLLSSDSERNFCVPFVLLMPYTAFLLDAALRRFRRLRPAAAVAASLLAAALAWRCAGAAQDFGWCFPDQASRDACALGAVLRDVVANSGDRGRSMVCRDPGKDDSCSSAIVCAGLEGLAEQEGPQPSDAFYRIEPCAVGPDSLLSRAGEKCLYQGGRAR